MQKLCDWIICLVLLFTGIKHSVSLFCYTVHWDSYSSFTEKIYECNESDAYCASLYDRRTDELYLRTIPLDRKCYTILELKSRINCSMEVFEEGCFVDPEYSYIYKRQPAPLPVCVCKGDFCNSQERIENVWLEQNFYKFHSAENCDGKAETESLDNATSVKPAGAINETSTALASSTETSVKSKSETATAVASSTETSVESDGETTTALASSTEKFVKSVSETPTTLAFSSETSVKSDGETTTALASSAETTAMQSQSTLSTFYGKSSTSGSVITTADNSITSPTVITSDSPASIETDVMSTTVSTNNVATMAISSTNIDGKNEIGENTSPAVSPEITTAIPSAAVTTTLRSNAADPSTTFTSTKP